MLLNDIKFKSAVQDSNGKYQEVPGARELDASKKFASNLQIANNILSMVHDSSIIWIQVSSPSKVDPYIISKVVAATDTHVTIQEYKDVSRSGKYEKDGKPVKVKNELFVKKYVKAGKLPKLVSIED